MAYTPDAGCLKSAVAAAERFKGQFTQQDILDAFEAMNRRKMSGGGGRDGLRNYAVEEGERAKIAAALRRRHVARNIIVRKKQEAALASYLAAGMEPKAALRTIWEGTQLGTQDGRKSISANRGSYEAMFVGPMWSKIEGERPHIMGMLTDERFDADVAREMHELRKDGKPGSTGNDDAKWLARVFADTAEFMRTELNRLGAAIGKLDGWSGVQTHDDIKLIRAGEDAWVGFIVNHLDLERTFPDLSGPEADRALREIYNTIITGFSERPNAAEKGQRVAPANLAKALGKHRVLHFKDADHALAYQREFGYGNTISGMVSHLKGAARTAAAMEALGPNPEVMFASLVESMKRMVKDSPNYTPKQKREIDHALTLDDGLLRQVVDVGIGLSSRPVNVTAASVMQDARSVQTMAKLGGALLSSFTDPVTTALAAQFRGNNVLAAFARQLGGMIQGRPKGEQAQVAYLFNVGVDGLVGRIVSPHAATDGPVGHLSKLTHQFFKLNGLTWWTDVGRSVAGRTIAAEMGMRAGDAYDQLPRAYRHVLGMNGIDQVRWDIIRKAPLRNVDGNVYITPDRIRTLPDQAFEPLVADRLSRARNDDARRSILTDARRDVELSLLRFVADETDYSVIKTDARTQRYMTLGRRPGTMAGETIRLLMQFKGFPLAFTERVVGRAFYGYEKGQGWAQAGHLMSIVAGLTIAGYLSMTAKDMAKGYFQPRDPGDWRTWLAAAQQGGAWGIYGDFLFSQTNRFGGGVLETVAGPTIGSVADLIDIGLSARDYALDVASGDEGKFSGGRALSWVVGNTPFANLFYTKPVMDWLFLDSMREALSPGYLKRQRTTRRREYGQEKFLPFGASLDPLGVTPAL